MTLAEFYKPDWVSPPGDTILEMLNEKRLSVDDFAKAMDMQLFEANDLLSGKMKITKQVAQKLYEQLGVSTAFWRRREMNYRRNLAERGEA